MALIEEYQSTGNWLFKKRSYIPIILYVLATVYLYYAIPLDLEKINLLQSSIVPEVLEKTLGGICIEQTWWKIVCYAISFLGILIRAITIGYTPKSTSGRNTEAGQVAEVLNTKGIYACVRHPLYVGNALMWLGILTYPGDIWLTLLGMAFFWLYYERIMFAEEDFLRTKFGKTYTDWAAITPAFIPNFGKWKSTDLDFSFKNIFKREYSGFLAVSVSMLFIYYWVNFSILHAINHTTFQKYITTLGDNIENIDLFWGTLVVFSILLTIFVKIIRKTTNWLEVEGR